MADADAQILFGLGRLASVARSAQWQVAGRHGLNPTQAEILVRIGARPMRQAEIAAHLGVSAASVSDSISAMVEKGLAARIADPQDRRAQQVVPTAKGRNLSEDLAIAPETLKDALGTLTETDRAGLMRALTRMIRRLQEARAIPVQRMCVSCRFFRPHRHADPAKPHHCEFVNAAFGDADLRLDCGEHETASIAEAAAAWRRFEAA